MSLIDTTYFKGDINIPVVQIAGQADYTELQIFIDKYEKEILITLFGYELYKLISAYDPDNESASEQRILDIIKGKEFDIGDRTYKWNGLINDDKVSIISYYVYVMYMKYSQTQTTNTGEVENTHENAINIKANQKISYAWALMMKLIENYNYHISDYYSSLCFFMSNNYSTYPEWEYITNLGSINNFDL